MGAGEVKAASETDMYTVCHTITSKNTLASSDYGSPVDLFSTTNELLMLVTCKGEGSATAYIGNGLSTQYIYKYGYERVDGKWQKITFSGEKTVGPWIVGAATTDLVGVKSGEKGKVLAYICQKIDGRWKCGCGDEVCSTPKWQRQEYSLEGGDMGEISSSGNIDGKIDLHYASSNYAFPGDKVTLTGEGFGTGKKIDVLWNSELMESELVSSNGTELSITVPGLTPGKYQVNVRDEDTESEYDTVIWIGDKNGPGAPTITSITPEMIEQGDEITITGTNFTSTENDIITSQTEFNHMKSNDEKTFVFDYEPFEKKLVRANLDAKIVTTQEEVWITVVNVNGISNAKSFILEI